MSAHRWVIALVLFLAPVEAVARDPRIPPGRDPGGIAVALISAGVDYTKPEIADRLARDGEGEVVGWDFADGDAFPFDARPTGGGTELARTIFSEAPSARLVPVRIDAKKPGSLTRALAFVGQTPARIVLLANGGPGSDDQEAFRLAARHFTRVLFILPATADLASAASGLENALTVEAAAALPTKADFVVEPPKSELAPALAAAARAAGAAANETARTPALDGAGIKRAMLQTAR